RSWQPLAQSWPARSPRSRTSWTGRRSTMQTDAEQGASLDLTKVKAGDTTTVRIEYTGEDPALPFEVTAEVTERRGQRWVGPVTIDREGGYTTTLIAHQPAPEPEPEWKRGTVARLSLVDDDLAPRVYRTG